LSSNLIEVPGRVLPLEQIQSSSRSYDGGNDSDWIRHLRSLPMFTCAKMERWVILAPRDCCNEVKLFTQTLAKAAQGMSFTLPPPIL